MSRPLTFAALLALLVAPAVAHAQTAADLVRKEIAKACDGKRGQIAPNAVIERDLTGDGQVDLIISHEGITCPGSGRSGFCGMQVCSVMIYVRSGAVLKLALERLGSSVKVGDGPIPVIQMDAQGGPGRPLKWNGREFR